MENHAATSHDDSWLDDLPGSEMGRLVAAHDWAGTPLGPPSGWPLGLQAVARLVLSSRFPMLVVWGPELVQVYNDAYRPLLGSEKHPAALGTGARATWPEVWDHIGPLFDQVRATGTPTWAEHERMDLDRNGFREECHFTYSYSAVLDDDGSVGGVLDVVTETTSQVVSSRRLQAVGDLAASLVGAAQVTDVCTAAVAALARGGGDVTSASLLLEAGDRLLLVASSLRRPSAPAAGVDLARVAGGSRLEVLDPAWTPGRPARQVAMAVGGSEVRGVLVAELNPMRPFDDAYRDFLELVGRTVGASLENAYRRAAELGEQRHISETLQRAMLEPASDLATVAARYVPAFGRLSVGGDWYDVISLPDGRRGLVVGDCVGHGLAAATAMGQLRSASRALLLEGNSPAEVLEAMDRFADSVEGAAYATMVCALVDVEAGLLTYASAGHLPPLLARADGSTWLEGGRGVPLAVGGPQRQDAQARLQRDDLLVLYTDGLVERRSESLDAGLERLRRATQAVVGAPVQEVADRLLAEVVDPEARDDLALVVKRVAPQPVGDGRAGRPATGR